MEQRALKRSGNSLGCPTPGRSSLSLSVATIWDAYFVCDSAEVNEPAGASRLVHEVDE